MYIFFSSLFWAFYIAMIWKHFVYVDYKGAIKEKGDYLFVQHKPNNEFNFEIGWSNKNGNS